MHLPSRALVVLVPLLLLSVGCQESADSGDKSSGGEIIQVDGSSTVFPISEAVAEEYQRVSGARVTIGVSGTGGGFKKLCRGEIAVSGASRPIKGSEVELCKKAGVEYIELPIAYDGLAVVVHKDNTWVDKMTVAELKALWEPSAQGRVMKWSQVRSGWPDEEIHLFGAGVDSGTYDYFTEAVVGTEHSSRGDFTSSEDDNVLVQGISTDKLALGFFGFAYYVENQDALKLVPIDDGDDTNGEGAIAPSPTTVSGGTYQPLSRPIFVYVNAGAAARPEVKSFLHFFLEKGGEMANRVGYIALPADAYQLVRQRFDAQTTGSLFEGGGSKVGASVEDLLRSKGG